MRAAGKALLCFLSLGVAAYGAVGYAVMPLGDNFDTAAREFATSEQQLT